KKVIFIEKRQRRKTPAANMHRGSKDSTFKKSEAQDFQLNVEGMRNQTPPTERIEPRVRYRKRE
ncbi:MAG TPA: hypothetical protein VJ873_12135, partial [bacterium]|nr:hypothetical protein [bacterium]